MAQPSGIDLPGEKNGFCLLQNGRKDSLKRCGILVILLICPSDRGIFGHPLEMYRVVSSIATRGEVYEPHILKKVLDSKGEVVREITPVLQDRIELRNETWESLIRGMEKVVNSGTGRVCRGLPVKLAAKTGTAQNPQGEDHSWFSGFSFFSSSSSFLVL